ncbi:hypothetical protein STAL104432_00575 [Streptomyces albus]
MSSRSAAMRRGFGGKRRGAEEGARLPCILRAAGIVRAGEDLLLQAAQPVGFVAGPGGYVAAFGDEATVDRSLREHSVVCLHSGHLTARAGELSRQSCGPGFTRGRSAEWGCRQWPRVPPTAVLRRYGGNQNQAQVGASGHRRYGSSARGTVHALECEPHRPPPSWSRRMTQEPRRELALQTSEVLRTLDPTDEPQRLCLARRLRAAGITQGMHNDGLSTPSFQEVREGATVQDACLSRRTTTPRCSAACSTCSTGLATSASSGSWDSFSSPWKSPPQH